MGSATDLNHAQSANRENGGNAGESKQTCKKASCELSAFAITPQNTERMYSLDVAKGEPTVDGKYVLEIISRSDEPKVVELLFSGKCCHGKSASSKSSEDYKDHYRPNRDRLCPTVAIKGGNRVDVDQPNPVYVQVFPKPQRAGDGSFTSFIRDYLLPQNVEVETYSVQSKTCTGNGKHTALVKVFPEFSWKGSLTLGYTQHTSRKSITKQHTGFLELENKGEWGVAGEVEIFSDVHSWKLSAEYKRERNAYFPAMKNVLDTITPFFSSLANEVNPEKLGAEIEIEWPQIALSGGIATQEIPESYDVDAEGSFKLDFNPLFRANFKVDILEWVIRITGLAFSNFLIRIKRKAEDGFNAGTVEGKAIIGLYLTSQGEVTGTLEWKKVAGRAWETEGSVSAGLGLSLEGKVEAEGKFFLVKMTMGASIQLKGAEKENDFVGITGKIEPKVVNGEPTLDGQLKFSGAGIYYTMYSEIAIEDVESEKKSRMANNDRKYGKRRGDNNITAKKEASEKLVTFFNPITWPKHDISSSIRNIEL